MGRFAIAGGGNCRGNSGVADSLGVPLDKITVGRIVFCRWLRGFRSAHSLIGLCWDDIRRHIERRPSREQQAGWGVRSPTAFRVPVDATGVDVHKAELVHNVVPQAVVLIVGGSGG